MKTQSNYHEGFLFDCSVKSGIVQFFCCFSEKSCLLQDDQSAAEQQKNKQ